MANFITVSSQGGSSKTLVNVDSLNRVSYHLSKSAQNLMEGFPGYYTALLFKEGDFYSVLDVNGSNVNSVDSIDEIEDKLNNVKGSGHGMTYVPHALVKANKEVFSNPDLLASYFSGFADYICEGEVFRGSSEDVELYWTDEMVNSVLSLYKTYTKKLPNDYSYEFAFTVNQYSSNKLEFIKGKTCKGIHLANASKLRVGKDSGMLLSTISSFDLRSLRAERCITPKGVYKEEKGGVVGVEDYSSVLVSFPFSDLDVIEDIDLIIRYFLGILKDALGVDSVRKFLDDLFDMFCTVEHGDFTSYLSEYPAADFIELKDEHSTGVLDSYVVKGDYVYIPLLERLGGIPW